MFELRCADVESLPWLDFVAAGGQSHVFGTDGWVVKISRKSWQTALGRVLVHPATPVRALGVLGGLLEPFLLLERAVFRGPRVVGGRAVPGSARVWSGRRVVAAARQAAGDFLDHRIQAATPGEAAELMAALLDTLDAIRVRGWHVLDFIMSNFVVGADGRVRLVDAGLLIPVAHLRGPSQQVCSRFFVRRMVPDYRAVLEAVAARHPGDRGGQTRLRAAIDALGPRIQAWRSGLISQAVAAGPPAATVIAPAMRQEIIDGLVPVRRKLPLTSRPHSGYTPSHHAIPSEN